MAIFINDAVIKNVIIDDPDAPDIKKVICNDVVVWKSEEVHTLTTTATFGFNVNGSTAKATLDIPIGDTFRIDNISYTLPVAMHSEVNVTANNETVYSKTMNTSTEWEFEESTDPLPTDGVYTSSIDSDTVVLSVCGWASANSWQSPGFTPQMTVTVTVTIGV